MFQSGDLQLPGVQVFTYLMTEVIVLRAVPFTQGYQRLVLLIVLLQKIPVVLGAVYTVIIRL